MEETPPLTGTSGRNQRPPTQNKTSLGLLFILSTSHIQFTRPERVMAFVEIVCSTIHFFRFLFHDEKKLISSASELLVDTQYTKTFLNYLPISSAV
jgi:hypothetical protein